MRILIVEDNDELASLIGESLRGRGFSCDRAGTLAEADAAVTAASYDAMVLDLGLPDGDGSHWLKSTRSALSFDRSSIPTIVLTSRGALADRIGGLDAGADDYLVKPVDMDELASRLRALLRRPGPRAPVVFASGRLTFDTTTRVTRCQNALLDLSRKEAALLELFMRREGSVVQRHAIEEALYSFDEPVTPNAIEAVVSRLRRKLEEAGEANRLHTVRGVGYLLRSARP